MPVMNGPSLRRFFSTPKGLLIIVLTLLAALAMAEAGIPLSAPGVVSAVAVAGLMDALILRNKTQGWVFPDGAMLTGLIIAMILSPYEPWHVAAFTSMIAVLSKHLFRTRFANVFNPAALGLVVSFYVFGAAQSWWGALGELPSIAVAVLLATGFFIADRVNKLPLVLVFLGMYFLLFTLMAFLGDPAEVAEIFRAPDLHAALYFAFFILTDPPTSPVKYAPQIIFGVIVALSSFAVFELSGAVHYLLSGVIAGNIWEAWRRRSSAR
jgi:Na+-translocating ferredoxin:NAD+ oxidoreductase RnfD subunit